MGWGRFVQTQQFFYECIQRVKLFEQEGELLGAKERGVNSVLQKVARSSAERFRDFLPFVGIGDGSDIGVEGKFFERPRAEAVYREDLALVERGKRIGQFPERIHGAQVGR